MLPNPDHEPPGFSECQVNLGIALLVRSELWQPVVAVGFGLRAMIGAAVPKASVNKDGDFGGAKHHVGSSAKFREGSCRDAISKSFAVNERPNPQLRVSVAASISHH